MVDMWWTCGLVTTLHDNLLYVLAFGEFHQVQFSFVTVLSITAVHISCFVTWLPQEHLNANVLPLV